MAPLRVALVVVLALAVGAGGFLAGRVSAPAGRSSDRYFAGLQAGEVQGRLEGRAGQEVAHLTGSLAARVRRAFQDGYAAGANDVFAGYDGGWALGKWIVTLALGGNGVTYRIADRQQLRAGVDYYLCSGGSRICERAHR